MLELDAGVDLLLTGARVLGAGGQPGPAGHAIAISGWSIAAIGPDAILQEAAGAHTRRADLGGLIVGPAFADAHAHPPIGSLYMVQADLHDVRGREAYGHETRRWAHDHPEAPWVVGAGWADGSAAEDGLDAAWLESLGIGRPILLRSRAWHSALVDPLALRLAGITADTSDPPEGRIGRDADRRPTGFLHEAAVDLVARLIPEIVHQDWVDAILRAQALFHRFGVAAWQDAAVYPATLAAYRELDAAGLLTMRTSAALLWDRHRGTDQLRDLEEARRSATGPRLRVDTVKIMLDGIVESSTAALERPYRAAAHEDRPRGDLIIEPAALAATVQALEGEGWSIHVHAVGDRAVRTALEAFESAGGSGGSGRRRAIAHIELLRPPDAARFARAGVTAVVQPVWSSPDGPLGGALVHSVLGPSRARRTFPLGQLERAGASLAFGSDWRVSTQDPLAILRAATRESWDPLSPVAAFRAATRCAFEAIGVERSGEVAAGGSADLVVVSPGPDGGIDEGRVVATIVGGAVVYADDHAAERGLGRP